MQTTASVIPLRLVGSEMFIRDRDRILQDQLKSKLINNGVTILQPETVRVSYDTKIGRDSIIEPFVVIKKGVNIKSRVLIKSHSNLEKESF